MLRNYSELRTFLGHRTTHNLAQKNILTSEEKYLPKRNDSSTANFQNYIIVQQMFRSWMSKTK